MAELRREGIEAFENFTRMPPEMYDEVLARVAPRISKTHIHTHLIGSTNRAGFQEPGVWSKMRSRYWLTDSRYYYNGTQASYHATDHHYMHRDT